MVKCGLGHAVPNTVIDRPAAPPSDADAPSMGNRPERSIFAYGCPLNEMGRIDEILGHVLSILSACASCTTDCSGDCSGCTAHALPARFCLVDDLVGSDIQNCGYTHIPETHISTHLPHQSQARPCPARVPQYHSPRPVLPSVPLPFPSCLLRRPAEKGPSSPLRLRSRCPKRNSHQTEQI